MSVYQILTHIPNELKELVLSFHPLFFNYKREYVKTTIINDSYHRDDIITLGIFNRLKTQYSSCYNRLFIGNSILSFNIFLYFETNNDCEIESDSLKLLEK